MGHCSFLTLLTNTLTAAATHHTPPIAVDGDSAKGRNKEVEMSVAETPKKTSTSQIVKLDKALKLAEVWVNSMSKGADDDEQLDTVVEGRPERLGLGAKVLRKSKVGPSDDPVDRKLYAKMQAEKRKTAKIAQESAASNALDDEEYDEELESRASAFTKRKVSIPSTLPYKKKK
ncbi:hypothetical protein PIB30_008745 [Stylosanthes scabra]|uniref:Uncharacterized protein n=1 Tax=Stylosanthes scabra TaxID=79078 RepID=A0ABU6V3B7_9FABA|nr:hypothetical protein [Stylosanthes scabra]